MKTLSWSYLFRQFRDLFMTVVEFLHEILLLLQQCSFLLLPLFVLLDELVVPLLALLVDVLPFGLLLFDLLLKRRDLNFISSCISTKQIAIIFGCAPFSWTPPDRSGIAQ